MSHRKIVDCILNARFLTTQINIRFNRKILGWHLYVKIFLDERHICFTNLILDIHFRTVVSSMWLGEYDTHKVNDNIIQISSLYSKGIYPFTYTMLISLVKIFFKKSPFKKIKAMLFFFVCLFF